MSGLHVTVDDDARDVRVEVAVAPGRTLAVVGPNGAGKSTLLSVVAGLYVPTSGRVVLTGGVGAPDRVLTDTDAGTLVPPARRGVVLLGQRPELFEHLSVRANVAFGPRSAGLRRADAREVATRWLDAVGAQGLTRRRARALSGGQAQRVAIARAFAAEPQVVLLDEPLAAVDAPSVPHLREVLRRALMDVTALVVTHDVADALALADDVVVVDRGRVVEHGPAAEVLDAPRSAFLRQLPGATGRAGILGSVSTPGPTAPSTSTRPRTPASARPRVRSTRDAPWRSTRGGSPRPSAPRSQPSPARRAPSSSRSRTPWPTRVPGRSPPPPSRPSRHPASTTPRWTGTRSARRTSRARRRRSPPRSLWRSRSPPATWGTASCPGPRPRS
ncbi:hypothetical protein GCM10025864_30380 [Luteimicrobium album]|uniref:ABC transporter domain-containing protein n=1 Tax=Luteimicrobium album TaxID=1054550 RepID=A0ABQ6I680_9MICO|nr:hypothetical protein GCM10025864_30380 [Luteimicrobium album]